MIKVVQDPDEEGKVKRFSPEWMKRRANSVADSLIKATGFEADEEQMKLVKVMVSAAFGSAMLGSVYLITEQGEDLSPLKDTPGYGVITGEYNKKPDETPAAAGPKIKMRSKGEIGMALLVFKIMLSEGGEPSELDEKQKKSALDIAEALLWVTGEDNAFGKFINDATKKITQSL